MRRGIVLVVLAVAGIVCGTALAAFTATTSSGLNTFTTRAVASKPTIGTTRITTSATCAASTPGETIRQGTTYYVCVDSVTDPAGVASVTANLSTLSGSATAPLYTAGGPFSGYAYRSPAQTAPVPLETGTSGGWSVRATNTNGDRSTQAGLTYNIRSFRGMVVGEFGGAAEAQASQYYRLSDLTGTGTNLGTGGTAAATYTGSPVRGVPGALVGDDDDAVRLATTNDYLTVPRRPATGLSTDYTYEIWVKGSATSGLGPGTVWSDSAGLVDAGNTGSQNDSGVAVDASGRIVAGCGNGATIRSAAGALSDGAWHHVAFTRVRTTGAIALYLDGLRVANAATCNTTSHAVSTTIWFGRSHESALNLTADLDEPIVWNRALSTAEVVDHYRLGTGTG